MNGAVNGFYFVAYKPNNAEKENKFEFDVWIKGTVNRLFSFEKNRFGQIRF